MFHITWTTSKFNRDQLEMVSAYMYVMVTMPNCHSYVHTSGFSLGRLHMGGICHPIWGGGEVQGDKALMGGLMRGT